jgi:hypothetical protein
MTWRFVLTAAALTLALATSSAVRAQPRNVVGVNGFACDQWLSWTLPSDSFWGYYYSSGCMAWDGYRWFNMCYRSPTFARPAYAQFHRGSP